MPCEPGFYAIDRINEIVDKLEVLRTGYNGFNIDDLADWLRHDASELKALAEDTRQYMKEILNPDYPDEQLSLNVEYDIKEEVYVSRQTT